MNIEPVARLFPSRRTVGLIGFGYGLALTTLGVGYILGRILSVY